VWSGTGPSETADDHDEEGVVAAVVRLTVATPGQVPADGRGLFRRKLAIQIFPQSRRDLGTLH
jgi:hypothetical protein